LKAVPNAPLFARRDGRPFDVSVLDRLVRRLAATAGVSMPGDAAAHAFRHHFGVQLAVRGVPVPVIQELMGHRDPRTTSIYMRMTGRLLIDALDDAGWL
jgi:integrase/recombinase XerD